MGGRPKHEEDAMHARVTRLEGSPERIDEGLRMFDHETLPAARTQDGFCGAVLLGDRKSGQVMAVTFWESEAHLRKSEEMAQRLREEASQRAEAMKSPSVERFEVLSYAIEPEIDEATEGREEEPPRVSP
jgi:heme-degrading monooxygenase HmoA